MEPITDRLMYITLRRTLPSTTVCTYTPPSDRPSEEQIEAYEDLQVAKRRNKAPLYVLGDWKDWTVYPMTGQASDIIRKQNAQQCWHITKIHRKHKRKQRHNARALPSKWTNSHKERVDKTKHTEKHRNPVSNWNQAQQITMNTWTTHSQQEGWQTVSKTRNQIQKQT